MAITGSGSGGLPLNATLGISVSGMTDATVTDNTLSVNLQQHGSCPQAGVGASVSAGLASGTSQSYRDVLIQGCI